MSDVVDDADEHARPLLDAQLKAIRDKASQIPVGEPGNCEKCDEFFTRIVKGYCARCRDKYKLG